MRVVTKKLECVACPNIYIATSTPPSKPPQTQPPSPPTCSLSIPHQVDAMTTQSTSQSAASLTASVTSLRSSLTLLDSSISILDAGIADFPRLKTVLSSTRVRPFSYPPSSCPLKSIIPGPISRIAIKDMGWCAKTNSISSSPPNPPSRPPKPP